MSKLLAAMATLAGAAALLAADGTLAGTNWVAVELMGKAVSKTEDHPVVSLQLHDLDKKLTGFSGCNTVSGGYEVSHEDLKFDPVTVTRVACVGEHMEPQYLQALAGTKTFSVSPNTLELRDMNGKVLGKFQASGPAVREVKPTTGR
jgi:heat shock protein HslJ